LSASPARPACRAGRARNEIGFADLMPGSGHDWGGFVNVSRIEVYGWPVPR
jgi:hypothetical protein